MSAVARPALVVVLVVLTAALFVGGPGTDSARSFHFFWDLGHIFYFALVPVLLFRVYRVAVRFASQAALTLALAVPGGALIELAQTLFGRMADPGDVARNALGGLVGIFFLVPGRRALPKTPLRLVQAVVLMLVAAQLWPLVAALADEAAARRRFPVLADFETPFEADRWSGNAAFGIDRGTHQGGAASLRVVLNTSQYSGVFLDYFPGDWRGFRTLEIALYNASPQELSLVCRIHDRAHTRGDQRMEDRFNRSFSLPPGWTTIAVDLEEVAAAPKGRRMDMSQVHGLGLFAVRLPEPRVIHIDDVRLMP